ncbi:MAG: hypothetical protein CSA22_04980 [Deltaproteobacteria bacterium]|nr:MAG: hypothetical protein CSA22_04980 [Deltaproteobacteria bacterium]
MTTQPRAAACTLDVIAGGRIRLYQHKHGYRFSMDPVFIAHFLDPAPESTGLDAGTGCGIIPLLLTDRHPQIRYIHAVEIQPNLAALAEKNVRLNNAENRIQIHHGDVLSHAGMQSIGPVDWIISNPPFYTPDSGRISPCQEKALANHAFTLPMERLVRTCRDRLSPDGQAATIYPANRTDELIRAITASGGHIHRLRFIRAHADAPDQRVMIAFGFPAPGAALPNCKKEAPLVVYQQGSLQLTGEAAGYYR